MFTKKVRFKKNVACADDAACAHLHMIIIIIGCISDNLREALCTMYTISIVCYFYNYEEMPKATPLVNSNNY